MAAQSSSSAPAKPAAPRPSAPRPSVPLPPRRPATREAGAVSSGGNIAENFDQFVKKFLKESK
jgi:hypothetical protein